MTFDKNAAAPTIHPAPLYKRMLQGAAIALVLIILFLASADEADPAWPKFWMIRPLIIVPIAGAMGGAFHFFLDDLRSQGGWRKTLAILLSIVGFLIALWMGTILGLDGTMWN